jgi:hypothetical protein
MPAGFETYDQWGRPLVSLTSQLARVVTKIENVASKGAINVPDLAGRRPFIFVIPQASTDALRCPATVQISGTLVSWTFSRIAYQEQGSPPAFYNNYQIVPSTILVGYY